MQQLLLVLAVNMDSTEKTASVKNIVSIDIVKI